MSTREMHIMNDRPLPSFINIRVIVALMMREMTTRYGRSAGGYVWALLEPVGMIAIMAFVFGLALHAPSLGDSFILFFATGYLPFSVYQELSQFSSAAIQMNKPLLSLPRVTPIDAILARFMLQFITISVVSVVIFCGVFYFESIYAVLDFSAIISAFVLAALLGLGVGTANAVAFAFVPTYQNFWRILTRPMFLISAVLFTYEDMPSAVQSVLWYNPVAHITGLMRRGFYSTYDATYVSEIYVAGFSLTLLAFGLFLIYSNRTFIVERK